MCIVIDANVFSLIHDEHPDFKHVLDWVQNGKGKFVFGGSTYQKELAAGNLSFMKLLNRLTKAGKTFQANDNEVDKIEKEITATVNKPDFDDPHIFAIIVVSRCKLICSDDRRSFKFIKDTALYVPYQNTPYHAKRPKFYRSAKQKDDLLNDEHIAGCCK